MKWRKHHGARYCPDCGASGSKCKRRTAHLRKKRRIYMMWQCPFGHKWYY